jgi:hypothetical protein
MVICTKYSLDAFRNQGHRVDPGDLRRFTMSGAVFHPVNLHPNSSALSNVSNATMNLAGSSDFIALADTINDFFNAFINTTPGTADGGLVLQAACKTAVGGSWTPGTDTVGSSKVKAGA